MPLASRKGPLTVSQHGEAERGIAAFKKRPHTQGTSLSINLLLQKLCLVRMTLFSSVGDAPGPNHLSLGPIHLLAFIVPLQRGPSSRSKLWGTQIVSKLQNLVTNLSEFMNTPRFVKWVCYLQMGSRFNRSLIASQPQRPRMLLGWMQSQLHTSSHDGLVTLKNSWPGFYTLRLRLWATGLRTSCL